MVLQDLQEEKNRNERGEKKEKSCKSVFLRSGRLFPCGRCRFLVNYLPISNRRKEEMSQHRSLRGSGKITSNRNVLNRFERVNLLQKRGEWKEGSRGLGLKKTKPEA